MTAKVPIRNKFMMLEKLLTHLQKAGKKIYKVKNQKLINKIKKINFGSISNSVSTKNIYAQNLVWLLREL